MKNMMQELTSVEQLEQLQLEDRTHILVFSADWCPDCMFIKPFLPKLIEKYNELNFLYIDTTKFPALVKEYGVLGIPSFIAVKHDEEIIRFVSKLRKTEAEIDAFLKECC